MPPAHTRGSYFPTSWKLLTAFFLAGLLLTAACAPLPPPPPPQPSPSKVISEEGIEYFVYQLKLPGTSQELKLKADGNLTWLPLNIVKFVFFSGETVDNYRHADVVLASGEKVRGELYVGYLVEGNTDLGYWNMPLEKVSKMALATP
jgi:hypothetical protein